MMLIRELGPLGRVSPVRARLQGSEMPYGWYWVVEATQTGSGGMNFAALLFDVARLLPDRLAVSDSHHSWSYRELIERAARIGGALRARGLAPGDRVLLSLENCGEFFELLFGCWMAGLCAVPANARLHPREVEYIAGNSGARLLSRPPASPRGWPRSPVQSRRWPTSSRPAPRNTTGCSPPRSCVPSRAERRTGPGCSTPPAPPDGRKVRR